VKTAGICGCSAGGRESGRLARAGERAFVDARDRRVRDHCGARRVVYTTSVSVHATEHANRHGALVEEVGSLGQIGLGAFKRERPAGNDRR